MEQENRYDRGGKLPQGLQEVVNNTGKPERVIKPQLTEDFNNDDSD